MRLTDSTSKASPRSDRGLSYVEVVVAIGVVGILAWAVVASQSATTHGTSITKLESDVATINQAIKVYVANGGSLSGISEPQAVLDKLKTTLSEEEDSKFVGFGGALIDPRLAARTMTRAETQSSKKRAVWVLSRLRFEIATTGEGVSGFDLGDAKGKADYGTESRSASNSALEYESGNGWIWHYTDPSTTHARPAPTVVTVASTAPGAIPSNPPPSSPPTPWPTPNRVQLQPPTFSQPAGSYPATNFDFSLSILNPNTSCSSWVMVSLNGGEYSRYAGPLQVQPGAQVSAYVAGDTYLYYSSGKVDAQYTSEPQVEISTPGVISSPPIVITSEPEIQSKLVMENTQGSEEPVADPTPTPLEAPVIAASALSFQIDTTESISVSLKNPNTADSAPEYCINGNCWQAYTSSLTVTRSAYPHGLTLSARARATSAEYADSQTVSTTIGSAKLIDADADSSIASTVPDWCGDCGQLYCQDYEKSETLVYFNLADDISGPAKIRSATLYLTSTINGTGNAYPIYGISPKVSWTSGGLTWNKAIDGLQPDGVEVDASPASTSSATTTIPGVSGWSTRKMWDVTQLVQRWIDDPSTNNGVLVLPPSGEREIFCERTHPLDTVRPKLVIEWTSTATPAAGVTTY